MLEEYVRLLPNRSDMVKLRDQLKLEGQSQKTVANPPSLPKSSAANWWRLSSPSAPATQTIASVVAPSESNAPWSTLRKLAVALGLVWLVASVTGTIALFVHVWPAPSNNPTTEAYLISAVTNPTPKSEVASPEPSPLVAPFTKSTAEAAQKAWAAHLDRPVEFTNSIGMKFRLIPPGEYLRGAPDSETDARREEKPQHKVRITKPFYLSVTPVTQAEYQKVTGTNPSYFKGDTTLPVETVSWDDTQSFIGQMKSKESGRSYRLPTEAEWEYACRAGTTTPFWFGTELNGRQANCDGNNPYGTTTEGPYLEKTAPVAQYPSNPFGIYDQHGQVWEWCQDWYAKDDYSQFAEQTAVDPQGPSSGSSRCCRGGSWDVFAVDCRSACRTLFDPSLRNVNLGFRVVLSVE